MLRFLFFCFALLLACSRVSAAKIEVSSLKPPDASVVTITGRLELGDAAEFRTKTASIPKALVVLASGGGNLFAGIHIGEIARLKNYVTVVPDGASCASACALAWLGGARRLMGQSAKIGFHSASDVRTGAVSGVGDAFIGAYLNKIAVPDRAIVYLTSAAPNEIQWLNLQDAAKLGIDVEILSHSAPRRAAPPDLAAEPAGDPPSPAAKAQVGATADLQRAVRAECSDRDDALGLHGEPRRQYRSHCIASDAEPD